MAWIKTAWLALWALVAGKSIDWAGLLQLAEDTLAVLRDENATGADKYAAFLRFMEALKPLLTSMPQPSPLRAGVAIKMLTATSDTPEAMIEAIRSHVDNRLMGSSAVKFDGSILLAFMRLIQLLWPLVQAAI